MATELKGTKDLAVTAFWGGDRKGRMIQLMPKRLNKYSELNVNEVITLVNTLAAWLGGVNVERNRK